MNTVSKHFTSTYPSLFAIVCIFFSCHSTRLPYDSKELTYKNKFVFANQLKMDGYFYKETKDGILTELFFEDGYYGGQTSYKSPTTLCETINNHVRQIPYAWGCYIIENDTLKLQYFPGYGRDKYGKFMKGERWAKVEDQGATLRYFRKKDIDGKVTQVEELYKFHPCSNKPTSTNVLMGSN